MGTFRSLACCNVLRFSGCYLRHDLFRRASLRMSQNMPQGSGYCGVVGSEDQAFGLPAFSLNTSVCKYITSLKGDLNWNDIVNKQITESGVKLDARTLKNIIFVNCIANKMWKEVASLFSNMLDNQELSLGIIQNLYQACCKSPELLELSKKTIHRLYMQLPEDDQDTSEACLKMLMRCAEYKDEMLARYKEVYSATGKHADVCLSLLFHNDFKTALYFLRLCTESKLSSVIEGMMNHCIENLGNTITVSDVIEFLNVISKKKEVLLFDNFSTSLEALLNALNQCDDNYKWTMKLMTLQSDCICPNCKEQLDMCQISDSEIRTLQHEFESNIVYLDNNIYFKTNHMEWKYFKKFIETHDYGVVLDGLNLYYFSIRDSKLIKQPKWEFTELLEYFLDKQIQPIVIAKQYFVRLNIYKKVKKMCPIFLTDNVSDDDAFLIYAALTKGKGCYIVSRDLLRNHLALFPSSDSSILFRKWQKCHQCIVKKSGQVMFPVPVYPEIQLSRNEKSVNEFKMHFMIPVNHFEKPCGICATREKRNAVLTDRTCTAEKLSSRSVKSEEFTYKPKVVQRHLPGAHRRALYSGFSKQSRWDDLDNNSFKKMRDLLVTMKDFIPPENAETDVNYEDFSKMTILKKRDCSQNRPINEVNQDAIVNKPETEWDSFDYLLSNPANSSELKTDDDPKTVKLPLDPERKKNENIKNKSATVWLEKSLHSKKKRD